MQVQAVRLIAEGTAPRLPQPEEGATYEGIQKKETARVSTNPSYPTLPVSGWRADVAQGSQVQLTVIEQQRVGLPQSIKTWRERGPFRRHVLPVSL